MINDDIGNGCNEGGDEDDHDLATITINTPVFDLALRKTVAGGATSFVPGDIIPFAITVINQGSVDATNVEVTDYIPAGLELADDTWTTSGDNAVRIIENLPAGQSVPLSLNLRVSADATAGSTINWAEISSDEGDDIDSTPDADNTNDCHGTAPSDRTGVDAGADDNVNGSGDANNNGTCDAGEDEDDHDPAVVVIETPVFDLALVKSVVNPADEYFPGETLTYEITVTNQGDIDATNIVVTDYVPAGMTVAGG